MYVLVHDLESSVKFSYWVMVFALSSIFPVLSSLPLPQQYMFESVPVMQLWFAPAANCDTVTPEGRATYPGASLEDEFPRPSCPSVFLPQQTRFPSSPVEQAWADPASTAPASNPAGRSTMTA